MSEVKWQVLGDLSDAWTHTPDPDKALELEAAAGRLTRTISGFITIMLELTVPTRHSGHYSDHC